MKLTLEFRLTNSDDEDYMVIFDRNSFSYKITYANDLKTNSEYNEKVNMHLFPSPEPTVSCLNGLDFFKDFENEFPAIVYNDALTSKSDFSTEPTLCPQHIDEFDLKDETSLSEYDEEEQNILYFNDLFLSTMGPRMVNPLNARNPIAARGLCFECGGTDQHKAACPRLNRAPRQGRNRQNQVMAIEGGQGRRNNGNQA
ncbi:hypothetical protein Tco_1141985, partial [Tanacetum coccineum]